MKRRSTSDNKTTTDLVLDQAQVLAHCQEVGYDVVAGIARHAEIAAHSPEIESLAGAVERIARW